DFRFFQEVRERTARRENRQRAQHLSSQLKFLISALKTVGTQNLKVVDQKIPVALPKNAFERGAVERSRKDTWVRKRIEKTQKRTEAWCALQLNPCLPFRRFENAGNNVT